MITPYSGLETRWPHPLLTRRTLQTNCDLAFDFDWKSIIGEHNQPKFPGLQDLSLAVAQLAKSCGKAPLLLLTAKANLAFDELLTNSLYVAVVKIKDFLSC